MSIKAFGLSQKNRVGLAAELLSVMASSNAFSQDLQWSRVRAVGGGDGQRCKLDENTGAGNVQYVNAGGQIVFLFQELGINLPTSLNPFKGKLAWSASCNVEADVVVPAGYYVKTITQNLTFGSQKDVGPAGGVSTNGFLFQTTIPLNQINVKYLPKQQILNAFEDKSNTQIMGDLAKNLQCGVSANADFKTKFKLQILAAGARPAPFMSFIVNVDGADVSYGLLPSLVPCNL